MLDINISDSKLLWPPSLLYLDIYEENQFIKSLRTHKRIEHEKQTHAPPSSAHFHRCKCLYGLIPVGTYHPK